MAEFWSLVKDLFIDPVKSIFFSPPDLDMFAKHKFVTLLAAFTIPPLPCLSPHSAHRHTLIPGLWCTVEFVSQRFTRMFVSGSMT